MSRAYRTYPLKRMAVYGTLIVSERNELASYLTRRACSLGMRVKTMRLNERKRLVVRVA